MGVLALSPARAWSAAFARVIVDSSLKISAKLDWQERNASHLLDPTARRVDRLALLITVHLMKIT